MWYLKIDGKRYNLVGDQMVCDGTKLTFSIPAEGVENLQQIKDDFSERDEFIVYECVTNTVPVLDENGEETGKFHIEELDEHEFVYYEGFTRIIAINYDNEHDIYSVVLIQPMDIDIRMSDMESAMNFLLMGGE